MPGRFWVCLAAAALIATSVATGGTASAQSRPSESADQNVRASRQYESLVCTNPAFRAKRIAQECGSVTDPELHQSCVASFDCGTARRGSQQAPPSEKIR
jgi:hypothetical protein